jgi:hypothetical protein
VFEKIQSSLGDSAIRVWARSECLRSCVRPNDMHRGQCMSVSADRWARGQWQGTPVTGCRARGRLRTGRRKPDHPDSQAGQERRAHAAGFTGRGRQAGDLGQRLNHERQRVAPNVGRMAATLSADGAHGRRVLPIGVLRNPGRGLHGERATLACHGAIVAGPAFTATGYRKIRWTRPAGPPQEAGSTLRDLSTDDVAEPVLPLLDVNSRLGQIELAAPGGPSDGSSPWRCCCW